jgi:hypothetical protein
VHDLMISSRHDGIGASMLLSAHFIRDNPC